MHPSWYALPLIALALLLFQPKLRQEMLWTAVASLPLALLWPLPAAQALGVTALIGRLLIGVSGAAIASALYVLLFKKALAPSCHPLRYTLLWLVIGPASLLLMHLLLPISFLLETAIALGLDVAVLFALRPDLIWDALLSGFGLGFLYLILFKLTDQPIPLELETLRLTRLTLLGFPASQLLTVFLFGALWGPLYLAVKDKTTVPSIPVQPLILLPRALTASGLLLLAVVALGWGASLAFASPTVTAFSGSNSVSLTSPITIHFSAPIDRRSLQLSITPPIVGGWQFSGGKTLTHLYTEVQFVPDSYYAPGTTYTVAVAGIATVAGIGNGSSQFTVTTEKLPSILSVQPVQKASNVGLCDPLTIQLSSNPSQTASFSFHLEPEIPLTQKLSADGNGYVLTHTRCFDSGTTYVLKGERTLLIGANYQGKPEQIVEQSFTTRPAAGLKLATPSGSGVSIHTRLFSLTFDQAMKQTDPSGFLHISPAVAGAWQWTARDTASFTATATLQPGTTYALSATAGLADAANGALKADSLTSFTTLGPPSITAFFPADGTNSVSTTTSLSVRFDQIVDHPSAEAAFHFEPSLAGSYTWSGTSLYFSPSQSLSKNSQYTLRFNGTITDSDGQSASINLAHTFTTEESLTLLNIPLRYQSHALSCEVASLKMGLGYKGVSVSEEDIMSRVGYDATPRQGSVWGDPDVGFVGSLDGKQDTTGYGVHWGPLLRAANTYRAAKSLTGGSLTSIATSIAQGNPVVFWGIYEGGSFYDPWTTPSGKTIPAWHGEHVRLVIGFYGPANNPSRFIINDPIVGRIVWTANHFLNNWATYDRAAIEVE